MSKYISNIDGHKSSVIFTLLQDIETIYNRYDKGDLCINSAITQCRSIFNYLKGFLYGLNIKHQTKFVIQNGIKLDYLSFYNNSSQSIKYSLCVCFDCENFGVKYNRITKH